MKKLTKGLTATLAFGLVLSMSTSTLATETTDQESTVETAIPASEVTEKTAEPAKKSLKATANAVVAKKGVSFEIGNIPVASDFVTINDNTNNPTFAFKNGQPATGVAGNYSTVINVTFDDATSAEITANFTVNAAATPLAKLKSSSPIIAQDSKPTPSQFVTPATGVKLSFKSSAPSTKTVGTFTTTILATKDGKTEELVASFYIADQTLPVVSPINEDEVIEKGAILTPAFFVTATDNSGKVTLSFKPGHEATTSTIGEHEAIIIVKDAAGNTREVNVAYFVGNNIATLKTPVLNAQTSTATTIYGTTSPNVMVELLDINEETIAITESDAKGNFTFNLKTPVEQNEEFILVAYDYNGNYSDEAIYTYVGESIKIAAQPKSSTKVKPNINVKKANTKSFLPKTGDENSLPLIAIGLLLAGGATITLRKKQA
ncbi:Ig-like domain-containing protein [Listeria ivanovii]|uniref:Putative peptidoglycan linked protein (LPXTG motif) n=2 Tax=Listeria ivanovii TaxID=1638 RepID=G2ZBY4_LISIP|nr:LPXTG cell wall anchor domain-containing protein [Listeria ivanovii]AHI55112.1 cell wall anchor [Listeria ivanovii WSLC3009]AIS64571.1 cell wall anchor [Listeria ivanovii subsp. ivanovii]MBC1758758.1 LPXTG cell wall anchor domain-containing protein [Listeria ivanovii]MCJ1716667.1 Ig-like domain-containing protein [Listeria ivanovii]MCJ1721424.1 Ig-like domain-containing protein [Listeria ivanovii]